MRRRGSWLTTIANLVVFILMEMTLFQLICHNAPLQRIWAARAAHVLMAKAGSGSHAIRDYFQLRSINEQLVQENEELNRELIYFREQLEHARLDPVPLAQPGFSIHAAEVVKMSRNGQHNYLILNKGFEDGIQEKSGVITRNGVVGIVDAVSAHHAFAFSFQNNDISISARLRQEGGSGLLVWDGKTSDGAILKEIPLQHKYEKGDTVYTSGHSLIFPPDIPLGVAGEAHIINGATNEIEVKLFQEFSTVRYVTVVHNLSFDEIEQFVP